MVLGKLGFRLKNLIDKRGEGLAIASILVILISFYSHSLLGAQLGPINISLYFISTAAVICFWLIVSIVGYLPPAGKKLRVALIFGTILLAWFGFQAFRSPDLTRGFTLFAQAARNILLLWLLGRSVYLIRDYKKLNSWAFLIGVIFSAASTILFLWLARDYETILTTPDLWKPPVIYSLVEQGVIRLEGFSGDPNFYSLWMLPSLFCGVYLLSKVQKSKRLLVWFGLLTISFSLVLAMSRGLAFAFATIFLGILGLRFISPRTWKSFSSYVKSFVVLAFLVLPLAMINLPGVNDSPAHLMLVRMGDAKSSPRFGSWDMLLDSNNENANENGSQGLVSLRKIFESIKSVIIGLDFKSIEIDFGGNSKHLVFVKAGLSDSSKLIGYTNGKESSQLFENTVNIALGSGLRSTELVLGGSYSHNSYLDLFIEAGIVGLVLWIVFLVITSSKSWELINLDYLLPWVHVWFVTLIFIFWFSLVYNPFLWVLAAVLVGANQPDDHPG